MVSDALGSVNVTVQSEGKIEGQSSRFERHIPSKRPSAVDRGGTHMKHPHTAMRMALADSLPRANGYSAPSSGRTAASSLSPPSSSRSLRTP